MSDQEAPTPRDPELRSRVVRGVVSLGARGFVIRALGFVGTAFVARELGPREFGQVALALSFIALANLVAGRELASAVVRDREEPERRDLEAVFGVQLALAFGLLALSAAGLAVGGVGTLIFVMAVSLPIDATRGVPTAMAERSLTYGAVVRADVLEILALNVVSISLVLAGMGVYAVAVAVVVRAVVGAAVLLPASPVGLLRPRWAPRRVAAMLRFGAGVQVVGLITAIRDNALNGVVAALAGSAALGLWGLAMRLLQVVLIVLESLWRVSFPAVSRLLDERREPIPLLRRGLSASATAIGGSAVALATTAPALVPLVFGDAWRETGEVMPVLALGLMLGGPVSTAAVGYLYAIGEAGQVARTVAAHAAIWLVGTVLLTGAMDTMGVAVAFVVASVAGLVYQRHTLRRHVRVPVVGPVAGPTVAAVAGGLAGLAAGAQLGSDADVAIAALIAGELVYLVVLVLIDRAALRELVGLVRPAASRP